MLKRLKNQLERKIASKEPVRYSYDLLVCSLEGLVMDTKEVEMSISFCRGGKRKDTSWRLVYPGESRAFFDEQLSQPDITLYRDAKPPFTFEEKVYEIRVIAKYVELGQEVTQAIGSAEVDLAKYATAGNSSSTNENFRIPLRYRGFTNNVATLKVTVKATWLKNLSGGDVDQASEAITLASEASATNYQTAVSGHPGEQAADTASSAQRGQQRSAPGSPRAVDSAPPNPFMAAAMVGADTTVSPSDASEEHRRLLRERDEAVSLVRTCEAAVESMSDDLGKLAFEVDGKMDELSLSSDMAEKRLEAAKRRLGGVVAMRSQLKLLEDTREETERKHADEVEKLQAQLEFLKQEALISDTKVGNLKRALQEREQEVQRLREDAVSTASRDFESAEEDFEPRASGDSAAEASAARARNEELLAKINAMVRELDEVRTEKERSEREVRGLREALGGVGAAAVETVGAAAVETAELEAKIAELESLGSRKEGELAETALKVTALTATVEALTRERDEARSAQAEDFSLPTKEELRESVQALEQQVAAKTREADESAAKASELAAKLTSLERESTEKAEDLAETVLKVTALTATVETLTRERDEARSATQAVRWPVHSESEGEEETEGGKAAGEDLRDTVIDLEEQVAKKAKDVEMRNVKIADLTSQIMSMEEESSKKEGELAETALKVTALTATVEALTRERDEARSAQAEDFSLPTKEELRESVQALEQQVAAKTREADESAAKASELAAKLTSLERESTEKAEDLAETVLKVTALTATVETLTRERDGKEELLESVKVLEQQVAAKTQEADESAAKVEELTAAVGALTAERDEARTQASVQRAAELPVDTEGDGLRDTVIDLEEQVAKKAKDVEMRNVKIADLTSQIMSMEEESSKKEGELAETALKVTALTATVEALTRERDEARSAQAEPNVAPDGDQLTPEEEEELLQSLMNMEQQVAAKTREADESAAKASELAAKLTSLERESTEKAEDLAETVLKVTALTATVETLTRERDEARSAAALADSATEGKSSEDGLEVAKLQGRVSELESELEFLRLAQEDGSGGAAEKEGEFSNIKISEEAPPGAGKTSEEMLAELIQQKTSLQEENSFLIGELTEAKIELAELKMR